MPQEARELAFLFKVSRVAPKNLKKHPDIGCFSQF